MDEFERIELIRALGKLDKTDGLVEALEEATETMSELIEALDNHAQALNAAAKKQSPIVADSSDVKPSN